MAVRYGASQFLLRSTVRLFCNGTGTLRWHGTLVRCLNLPTKRFMCNVWTSMKIRDTVPDVHRVYAILKQLL